MATKAMDLFEAYAQNKLPKDAGFIVSAFFAKGSTYSKYTIVSYSELRSAVLEGSSLCVSASGRTVHVLVEPPDYADTDKDPADRQKDEQFPLRLSQMDAVNAKNGSRMLIARKPLPTTETCVIERPTGIDFALIFFKRPDLFETLTIFLEKTFNKEANVPLADAKRGATLALELIKHANDVNA